jgi:DNA polymerase III sliding clamp (beta) subunit (PCNA family)
MQLEFATKQMSAAMKAVKKMFDKGPFAEADPGCQDCLVASISEGSAMLESAANGLYTKATFPADVKEAGKVVINRASLHALKLFGERSTFKHKPGTNQLEFKSGQFVGKLSVSEVFAEIEASRPAKIPELSISMPALTAKAAGKRTCLNATLDTLLRMKLTVEGKCMTLSCNDNFRAAAVRSNLDDDSHGEGEIEVPAVFFNTVLQSIEDSQIHIGFNDNIFRVAGGGFDICHPVMGKAEKPMVDVFERFDSLKKTAPDIVATIDTAALKDAISAVSSVAPVGTGSEIKIDLKFSDKNGGQVTTHVRSATSSGEFHVPLRSVQINNNKPIAINAKFLLEMMNLLSTDETELYAWPRLIILRSEKVGSCMIMPQLKTSEN